MWARSCSSPSRSGSTWCRCSTRAGRTWLDPVVKPFERLTYRVCGIDPDAGAGLDRLHDVRSWPSAWSGCCSPTSSCATRTTCRSIPRRFPAWRRTSRSTPPRASRPTPTGRATAASRRCRTSRRWWRWRSTTSPRPPPASRSPRPWCAASPASPSQTIGNFWVDTVRITYYLLVPICLVFALFLVSQGMIQNFKPYTVAKTYEPYTIQVPKTDAAGKPVLAADGKTPVDGGPVGRHPDDRAGPDGLADRDQDARDERRRLRQRQRRAPVREPDPALQLPPDALDLRHPERAHLLPRAAW